MLEYLQASGIIIIITNTEKNIIRFSSTGGLLLSTGSEPENLAHCGLWTCGGRPNLTSRTN